jgi:hypothetical protein
MQQQQPLLSSWLQRPWQQLLAVAAVGGGAFCVELFR